jgi:hypothetical protein
MVVTPLVAIATLAAGMRVGARRTIHAAIVYAAPRAHGESTFAWQVVTLVESDGTRETEARSGVTVHARAKGQEASWRGDTNDDGVGEARLALPGVQRGDPIDLEVDADDASEPLAKGRVRWGDAAWTDGAPGPFVRSSKRVGAIALDVAVLGSKLVARSYAPILVRATSPDDGHPLANVTIVPAPEPELDVREASVTTCPLGWARIDVSPKIYNGALGLHARLADGRTGEWFGSMPIATGSIHPSVPDVVKGDDAQLAVQARTSIYAEVDDREGRAFADWAKLPGAAGDLAAFHPPPLSPGLKWLVASTEPHGAEVLDEGTIARPFLVAGTPMPAGIPATDDACAVGGYLALHPAGGFRRWLALDGFIARRDANGVRRKRGLTIGLGSLAVASLLELVLLLQVAQRGRRLAPGAIAEMEGTPALVKRSSAASVLIGILCTLLGFGLLAAILLLRS